MEITDDMMEELKAYAEQCQRFDKRVRSEEMKSIYGFSDGRLDAVAVIFDILGIEL